MPVQTRATTAAASAVTAPYAKQQDVDRKWFFDLSAEVRNNIYFHALVAAEDLERVYHFHDPYDPPYKRGFKLSQLAHLRPALLKVCKAIYREACPVLYGANVFVLHCDDYRDWLEQIGSQRRHLRCMHIGNATTQDHFKWTLSALKDAKNLSTLSLHWTCFRNYVKPFTMAKALTPLIRSIHAERKDTDQKQALDVLQFENPDGPLGFSEGLSRNAREVKTLLAEELQCGTRQ